jgi:enamine deaminase RidA (YjgF/YER057c/UK114 family)
MPNLRPENFPPVNFPEEEKMSIQRFKIGPRMCQVVVHNDTVYLAGQVAEDTTADAKGQTSQILNQIDELLALVGTDKSKLLSATVYLSEMAHFGALSAAWEAWIDPANPPVRATVEAKLAAPKYQVEIAIIAAK